MPARGELYTRSFLKHAPIAETQEALLNLGLLHIGACVASNIEATNSPRCAINLKQA